MYSNKIILCCLFLYSIFATSCEDKFDLPVQPLEDYTKVYMPQAVNNPRSYLLKISDSLQEIIYSASCGGQDYPTTDISVTFSVSNELVDSFNRANGTNYLTMPDKSYDLSTNSATILHGTLSTGPLKIFVKTGGPGAISFMTDYLLPVSIRNASEKVNAKLATTFFKVRAEPDLNDYPAYDRSKWTIIGFSSQEASGEGPDNGRAEFVLDNKSDTYWHTQWQGGSPGPPHFLTIDLGEIKTLHGLSFLDRQSDGGGKPKEVAVQVSTDNITWVDAAAFSLANVKDLQPQFLTIFRDARYLKVIVNESYNASYTHLAELNAF
jgi:hypothetical protein